MMTLARGLADGTLAIDTRVRDALRSLARDEGPSPSRAASGALEFPHPTPREDAAYAAEASVLAEIDGIVRAERARRGLEGGSARSSEEPPGRLRRLARR